MSGGMKGRKDCELGWLPPEGLYGLGRVAAHGAQKYAPTNYRLGYQWSLSLNALWRHMLAFQAGQDYDPDSGLPHTAHAAWHALVLTQFLFDHPDFDDRFGGPAARSEIESA